MPFIRKIPTWGLSSKKTDFIFSCRLSVVSLPSVAAQNFRFTTGLWSFANQKFRVIKGWVTNPNPLYNLLKNEQKCVFCTSVRAEVGPAQPVKSTEPTNSNELQSSIKLANTTRPGNPRCKIQQPTNKKQKTRNQQITGVEQKRGRTRGARSEPGRRAGSQNGLRPGWHRPASQREAMDGAALNREG